MGKPCINNSAIFTTLATSEQFIQTFSTIFRHIQGYWCIFSHTNRRTIRRKRGGLPYPLRKVLIESHLWVNLSIQNVVLRVSRRKKLQNVSLQDLFFLCFWENVYRSALPLPPLLPWKNSGCIPPITHYPFRETLHLICSVTFCYIHIRHVQNSDIIGTVFFILFFRHMPVYSIIFSLIKAYSRILRHY